MPPGDHTPHRLRSVAESFGSDAERYDRTRPAYPDELIRDVVARSPGRDVLDVGCGTGIEARQLRAAGCTVLGVEPDERMARFARDTGIDVETAAFEDWDPAGRTFDAVVAGTAWHWVDPVAGAVTAARVLRPGGLLAVFWHVFELPPAVADAFTEVYRRVAPDSPFARQPVARTASADGGMFDTVTGGIRESGLFGEPARWRFDWEHTYGRDEWLDQMPTHGTLTWLPAERRAEVLAHVADAIDDGGGSFTMAYATTAITAVTRRPGATRPGP